MYYQEHKPAARLEPYIKCYYLLACDHGSTIEDQAFATGCIEVMFTLNGNCWRTKSNDGAFSNTSSIELWGQVLKPLTFRVAGYSQVFGIRFHPAAATVFLREDISQFSNGVFDFTTIIGASVRELHARLQEAESDAARVQLADTFFLKKSDVADKVIRKVDLVQRVMAELSHEDFFDNIENVANRYGITSRYLQKIFLHHTGLTPKLYTKINRFQNSLILLGQRNESLTTIAHLSGYFDQSHFIREFKSFTGYTPSNFNIAVSTAVLASPNK